MSAIIGLLVIGLLVLPFVAVFKAFDNGRQLQKLSDEMRLWMRRMEGQPPAPAPAPVNPVQATTATPPAAQEQPSAPAPTTPAPAPAPTPAPQPVAAAQPQSPRRDSVFKDESVFTDENGETWMEFSDAPASGTFYFDDAAPVKPAGGTAASPWSAPATPVAPAQAVRKEEGEEMLDRLWRWLTENWMLVTGAVFVFLSISWLVRYALIEDIITAEMRIAAGFVLGALLMALGQWRMGRYVQQGAIFMVLGAAAVILTMFAARELYGFFTPAVALGVTFVTASYVTWQAMLRGLPVLSYAALLMALVAPAITRAPDVSFSGLFGYLAAVLAATLWVVLVTGWRINILIALVATCFYSMPFWNNAALLPGKLPALLTASGFAAVFFIADMVGHFRAVRSRLADIIMPLLMAGFLTVWIFDAAEGGMRTVWLGLWALVFSVGSGILSRRTGARSVFLTYLAVSVLLLIMMTAAEFRGPQLVMMLTLMSALLTLLAHHVLRSRQAVMYMAGTLMLPMAMGALSLGASAWKGDDVSAHAMVTLLLAVVPLALAVYFRRLSAAQQAQGQGPAIVGSEMTLWVACGVIFGFGFIWRGLHAVMPSADFATAVAMVIYSFIGIAAYVTGHRRDHLPTRHFGLGVLGLVIARLILVDLPDMPVTARIVMFFGVGVLLLGTAFVRYRKTRQD